MTVIYALTLGKGVSRERVRKRAEICQQCPYVKGEGVEQVCGICDCPVVGDRKLRNLARFEETKSYGCKHPEESQWKKHGV